MRRRELDPRRGRAGRPWRRLVAEILVPGVECAWPECDCPAGRAIDVGLPRSSRWSGTVDHVVALADGGHPTDRANLQPMHRRCNSRKEAARHSLRSQAGGRGAAIASRDWS